ncbi:MAG TPA: CHAD domain-containing protein [Solirubrobacteraceae bacterium]|nr:CHAD domain-containing protein [Solirubrobacteraceae bacterium]
MAYAIEFDESVRAGFSRCAQEQLDRAIRELSERIAEEPVAAVHAARKAVKKERSLLRLVRGSLPPAVRRRENAALRDAARELSGARDAEVMITTLDALSERYAGQLPESTFAEIRGRLERRRDAHRRRLVGSALGAHAVQELGAIRVRADEWRLTHGGWDALQDGLKRSYKDGRAAFARVRSHPSATALHEWRKRVKDLWLQERLLARAGGPALAGQAKDAHRLSDLLGEDHDLAVLRSELADGRLPVAADGDAVIGLIDQRRRALQAEALQLGRRVYAEPPAAYVRRMRQSWKAGRRQAAAQRDQHPQAVARATRLPHAA